MLFYFLSWESSNVHERRGNRALSELCPRVCGQKPYYITFHVLPYYRTRYMIPVLIMSNVLAYTINTAVCIQEG